MRGGEISGLGPILSRFCRDPDLSRDKSSNSGSYGPLRDDAHHITKNATVRRLNRELWLRNIVSTGMAFQSLPRGPKAEACDERRPMSEMSWRARSEVRRAAWGPAVSPPDPKPAEQVKP